MVEKLLDRCVRLGVVASITINDEYANNLIHVIICENDWEGKLDNETLLPYFDADSMDAILEWVDDYLDGKEFG